MATRRQGYAAIPTNEEGDTIEQSPQVVNDSGSNLLGRVKNYDYRGFFSRYRIGYILAILILLALGAALLVALLLPDNGSDSNNPWHRTQLQAPIKAGISKAAMQQGLDQCESIQNKRRLPNEPNPHRSNPRASNDSQPILLKNAIVWDGQGNVLNDVDILMQNGVIKQVQADITDTPDHTKIIDVHGHIVSPGLVDMHSHLGLDSWPELDGSQETNEASNPLTPFVRSLDAFSPSDNAIRIVASGGVTTALVLPGSANIMGGEAFVFKLRPVPTTSNSDMLIQAGIDESLETKWRWMKAACGENPKRFYGTHGRMPRTRMGEAYMFRQRLDEARQLLEAQNDWCLAAQDLDINAPDARLESRFPEDLAYESLVALLRGDVRLNVHCYETHDLEAMIRHSYEFNFNISAFHHALDAYLVPDIIKRAKNEIVIATFADHWGYKKEAFQASPYGPKILHDADIPVALKSDHPVLNSQHLVFEAAKANHYGLPLQEAFKAVTSVPAKAIGLDHRVGSLKPGYDADVVIWDREPLTLGATPLQVFVDGIPLFDETPIEPANANYGAAAESHEEISVQTMTADIKGGDSFMLTNVGGVMLGKDFITGPTNVFVRDGKVVCAGDHCDDELRTLDHLGTMDVNGGYVIPGLIAVGSHLGMVEIPSEESTGDGTVKASKSKDPQDVVYAVDGIKLSTRHLEEAFKGGVMNSITAPMSDNVIVGVSTAFKTHADSLLSEGALITPAAALHLQIGDSAKSASFPTVSSQISFIRQILKDNVDSKNVFGQASRGEIPTVVSVHNKDEIASLIMLKQNHLPDTQFVVMGGAEAHLVAQHLAEANIPVILRPTLCTPASFDSIHCLTGAPLTNGTAAHVLHRHGVKIALGVEDDGLARNLAWDAGWLAATSSKSVKDDASHISEEEAMRFITTNIQEIFGLASPESLMANDEFVVWSNNPLQLHSRPLFTYSPSKGINSIV
ncbi:composite domain of metallo-dependent hydrolase [Lichtheimia hyalospora FSU 10163]|nr:composite domain of metallo-dependent hydrolase [Lichtheimia hyalospora FSU 10163]